VKQAQYNFVGASEQLESAHRNVVQTVRSSFNNVNASISSINAYKQAVVSAQSSLDAMEAGYSVGTVPSLTSRRDHHAVQRETAALQRTLPVPD
jgi:outer membrane protein TolC